MILVNLILSIAPAIFLLIYFYKKDVLKPEPQQSIRRAFFIGLLSILPTIIIGDFINDIFLNSLQEKLFFWLNVTIKSFISAAFLEEGLKLLAVLIFIFRREEFDEAVDGIIYTVTVSLGFAAFENVMYSINDTGIALLRAFTAVPGHAFWSGIMGFYIGLAKTRQSNAYLIKGFFWAVLLHGLYNFFVFSESYLAFLIIPLLVISFYSLSGMIKTALDIDRERMKKDRQFTLSSML